MKFLYSTILILLTAVPTVTAQAILGIDGEESTSVGIYIKEIATGKVIIDHNSQMALTPASVMKALTTATVLSVSGADANFKTPVVLNGTRQGNTWDGNLIVKASNDPTLESENFKSRRGFCDSIASRLRKMGIEKITGNIVVEQNLSDAGPIVQWEIEDVAWPYGAGLFGFNWRDNTVSVTPATGEVIPEAPGLEICVVKAKSNDLVRGINSNRLTVYTRAPADKRWTVNTTVPDPAAVFTAQLRKTLARNNITIAQETTDSEGEETTVYTHTSASYGDIMRSLMVRSDNLFAEGMLRTLAPEQSRTAAIKRERELWATRGVNTRYTIINDGSGLTRANRLSAHFLGDVLEWMAKSPMSSTYTSYFPRAGKDGTMRGFLAKSQLKGSIALKTGSVSSVQCYAGYRLNPKGEPTHVVVMMINGFFCPRSDVRKACENLLIKTFAPNAPTNKKKR